MEGPDLRIDEQIQITHLRLCRRAITLRSPIAALEEAAEEIVNLQFRRPRMAKTPKKRNAQDTTLRNIRALKKRLIVIEARVTALEGKGKGQ